MRALECHAWHGSTVPAWKALLSFLTLQRATTGLVRILAHLLLILSHVSRRLNAELEAKTAALVQEAEDLVVGVFTPLHTPFLHSSLPFLHFLPPSSFLPSSTHKYININF